MIAVKSGTLSASTQTRLNEKKLQLGLSVTFTSPCLVPKKKISSGASFVVTPDLAYVMTNLIGLFSLSNHYSDWLFLAKSPRSQFSGKHLQALT